MPLTFASYNIHKGVGADGRRDPERILAVLHELNADVIALQEVDRRFGLREAVISHRMLAEHSPWRSPGPKTRPLSLGWHGNALLVRRGIRVRGVRPVLLPTLEPRGAVCAELEAEGRPFRVVGMHLDLSGLRRRHQIRAICAHLLGYGAGPAVLMGDFNNWSPHGALNEFPAHLRLLAPGRSFPARRPVAQLDRIVISRDWRIEQLGVHHSALAAVSSDHLPVWARLALDDLPKF